MNQVTPNPRARSDQVEGDGNSIVVAVKWHNPVPACILCGLPIPLGEPHWCCYSRDGEYSVRAHLRCLANREGEA